MTPNEFKAWFDGFTEAFENRIPTKAQWARIKDRVAEIDGKSVTERVYVDRYWQYYPYYAAPVRPLYSGGATCGGLSTYTANATGQAQSANSLGNQMPGYQSAANNFNSLQAMTALGRAEAGSLS